MEKLNSKTQEESIKFVDLPAEVIEKLNQEEIIQTKGGGNPDKDEPLNDGNGCICF